MSIKQIFRNRKNYKGAIFIDRDGTINKPVGYLYKKEQLELLPTVAEGIRLLNDLQIAAIVITNQPVVAKGLITIAELKAINEHLSHLLSRENAYLDAIYSCPHHPDGAIKEFTGLCQCRKPNTLMCMQAMKDYKLSKILGIMGDSTRDFQLGKNLGIPTIAVQTGHKGLDNIYKITPDFVCDNFLTSVEKLLEFL